jgi:hypothetical protein
MLHLYEYRQQQATSNKTSATHTPTPIYSTRRQRMIVRGDMAMIAKRLPY